MDGKMIAEKRREKGLTQDALGAVLGISGKAVSKWERGLAQPDGAHMARLIDLLGLPVEQILFLPYHGVKTKHRCRETKGDYGRLR